MKTRIVITLGILILLTIHSCIPSLFPLYTEKDLITDDRIEGVWRMEEGGNIWIIERLDYQGEFNFFNPNWTEPESGTGSESRKTYRLEVQDIKEGRDTLEAEFLVYILELGGHTYLDYYPTDVELHHDFLQWHMIEVHNFSRIEVSDDRLSLQFFDPVELQEMIEKNKIKISHYEHDDNYLLIARTDELQKFVIKYSDDPKALLSPDILTRL